MNELPLTLSDEQQQAIDQIVGWSTQLHVPQEFKLGGYAGTGKTTVIRAIREALKSKLDCNLAAFTGKAVNVLQRKGLNDAQTLHSLMYDCEPLTGGGVEFHLKPKLIGDPDLIIVDEASMVSFDLYNDLKSFGTRLLFVGDPGQLEPVGQNPNLMRQPDFTLQTIHRQEEGNEIISLADKIRKGWRPTYEEKQDYKITGKVGFTIPMVAEADQVICAKNKTRTETNARFRRFLQKPVDTLLEGDKIIVLRNNLNYGVFNGMILFIDEVKSKSDMFTLADCHDEIGREFKNLRIWNEPFQREMPKEFTIPKFDNKALVYADWGYCITCHKSQGSEWDKVLLWHEWMPPQVWDMSRWTYTGVTRAAKQLTMCI